MSISIIIIIIILLLLLLLFILFSSITLCLDLGKYSSLEYEGDY